MSVVEQWAKGGLEEVVLPSGFKIRGKLPLTQDLILAKVVDQSLVAAALALDDKEPATFTDDERSLWVEWQRVLAANFIREAWDPKTRRWEEAKVTPAMLANGVPPDDVDALEDLVLRRRTPSMVTAHARFMANQIDADELKRVMSKEASGTIAAWSSFRPRAERGDRGKNGGDVREPAEPDAGDPGSGDRPSARRGARNASARRTRGR
jgi:hypothetical protein